MLSSFRQRTKLYERGLATVAEVYNAPVAAILDKIVLRAQHPRIAHHILDVETLLRERWPTAELVAFDGRQPAGTDAAYDLIINVASASAQQPAASVLDEWARQLERVRPDGVLAVQLTAPDDPLECIAAEAARNLGLTRLGAPEIKPEQAFERLVGPLCSELEIWRSSVWQRLTSQEAQYANSERGSIGSFVASLGGETSEAGAAFNAECQRLYRLGSPHTFRDGTTLCSLARISAVATRPSLMDIYSEYSNYHDHQLSKGWKS